MTGMRTRGFVIVLTVGALLASCGGGSSAITAPNTPKQIAADKSTILQAVLAADDLPLGYTGAPHVNSDDSDPSQAVQDAFAKCSGFPKRLLDNKNTDQPNVDAPDYTKGKIGEGPATEVDSSIEMDRSSKDISEPLAHLADPKAAKCFAPLFNAVFKQGLGSNPKVSFGAVTVEKLDVGSIGDQRAAFQGHVSVSAGGVSLPIEFNLYFVRSGRAIVVLTALGYSTTFDKALAEKLLKTMVDRLKAAS